ncbi:C-GCAxxG-C-C family protein [Anaeromyxobacter oryzae]|uniref:C_GCAxxG_C_C family protein n=1 Tax=Anaeromyxobacter oryzae TaxID=2918170 RepID=A0ABM7WX92_9BACT|nr:C-GCAxxG-C-C family protein [Anaeromyxobacter oryzae]BDG04097.1 hypothetical protein AMOR_30930 [Anaeromyxobacter oryzae]
MNEDVVRAIREKARVLYEGKVTPHRSCGIAIAETFGREPGPYQALRRGGITGEGQCGAIVAGGLVLGEIFGDPDPTGAVTPLLREAMMRYRAAIAARLPTGGARSEICNDLVARFPVFQSEERASFCTGLAATVAEIVAGIVLELGGTVEVTPIPPSR